MEEIKTLVYSLDNTISTVEQDYINRVVEIYNIIAEFYTITSYNVYEDNIIILKFYTFYKLFNEFINKKINLRPIYLSELSIELQDKVTEYNNRVNVLYNKYNNDVKVLTSSLNYSFKTIIDTIDIRNIIDTDLDYNYINRVIKSTKSKREVLILSVKSNLIKMIYMHIITNIQYKVKEYIKKISGNILFNYISYIPTENVKRKIMNYIINIIENEYIKIFQ